MEQGYRHFSHSHNLIIHQLPDGIEVSCSGCHSSGTETMYVCWQCNFFLHEQCYQATRSLKHPTHPSHPLTLVPYPTYLSNSFYCNSCQSVGTGLSYSCADCEFDLHVHCAYSIPSATSFRKTQQYHELVPPGWNGVENSNMAPNNVSSVSVPDSLTIPFTGAQDPCLPQNPVSDVQYYPMIHDQAYSSIPGGGQSSIPTAKDPPIALNLASVSIPTSSQNPCPTLHGPPTAPSVSVPTGFHEPMASAQYPAQTRQDLSMPPNNPSVSSPTSSQNPIASTQYPSMAQTGPADSSYYTNNPPNLIPSAQDPSMPQSGPSINIPTSSQNPIANAEYPSMVLKGSNVSVPTNPPNVVTSSQDPPIPQNELKDKEIRHFSHPHILSIVDLQEDEVLCSGCEETLVGKGYSCVKRKCDFHLHKSCFHLEKEIQHKSHPQHPLTLIRKKKNREFTCNACVNDGKGFTYHCSICKIDLHAKCVSMPETVKRNHHEHELKLYYSYPEKEYALTCDICYGYIDKDGWMYYCQSCDYGTHLGCVDCEDSEECEESEECKESEGESTLDPQAQLRMAQFQLELARQRAQLLSSLGASLSSLAG